MTNVYDPSIKNILPHEKMYTIQIGTERFVLSGASLSSDAPSYFTNYFSNSANADKVLNIDRSPEVFKLIYTHLQGYYLEIWDADTFTKVFTDSLYYNLPKLRALILNSEYFFANVGGESFKIPKQAFNTPGNSPNFFTIGNEVLYRDISQIIVNMNWIRPPPQAAPTLNRSPLLLKDLIYILQGVEIDISSDHHRRSLIKEARYYRFNALVQSLIKHKIIYNPFSNQEEIIVSLDYLTSKELVVDSNSGFLHYQRGYIDKVSRVLIIETEDTDVVARDGNLTAYSKTAEKLTKLFSKWKSANQDGSYTIPIDQSVLPSLSYDGELGKTDQIFGPILKGLFKILISQSQDGSTLYISARIVKADLVTSEKRFFESVSYV